MRATLPLTLDLKAAWVLPATILACVALAWHNRFIQDDAYISMRYADHLVRGLGLVWNPGERVEGYTNFLWTLVLAIPIWMGRDPSGFAIALGLVLFAGTLACTFHLAQRLLGSRERALIVTLLLGTNYTFSCYATGGLETQLQALLFTGCLALLVDLFPPLGPAAGRLALLSLGLGLALLTRLDSALLAAVVVPVAAARIARAPWTPRQRVWAATCLVLPATLLVGIWLAWKLGYYGRLLPNTADAKLSDASMIWGLRYLYAFVHSYWLWPFLLLALLSVPHWFRSGPRPLAVPAALVGLWLLYVVRAGGDFMEFRFLVPILPLVFIILVWSVSAPVEQVRLRWALVAVVLLGSLHHALSFRVHWGVESIQSLHQHMRDDGDAWRRIGTLLRETLGDDPDLVVGTTAAGAIPFYSRMYTVDMFGLNDPWVAHNGVFTDPRPGHRRVAPFSYLVDRGVHLVISHPRVLSTETTSSTFAAGRSGLNQFLLVPLEGNDRIPPDARILDIPIDADRKLVALYLKPHPRIEQAIAHHGWRVLPIVPG